MPNRVGKKSKKGQQNRYSEKGEHTLFVGSKLAITGGVLAAVIALGGQWVVGQIYSGYEARQLLEAVTRSAHYLGSAVVTASATIMALMLTMLSLTKQSSDDEFDSLFFKRIEIIGFLSAISLAAGILLLLFLSVPLQESDKVPSSWFRIIYYILIAFVAALSGLVVSIVLMLQNTISSLIDIVRPSEDEDISEVEQSESS